MLQPGDLIFVLGHLWSPFDDLIKVGEELLDGEDEYVHVAVYIGGSTIMEAQGFRKSGPANIGDYTGDYDIGRIKMTNKQRETFIAALHDENGLPYDWLGIFWLGVAAITGYDRKYHERRRRYCSKYVAWALKKAGIIVDGTTPESLSLDPRVTIEKG